MERSPVALFGLILLLTCLSGCSSSIQEAAPIFKSTPTFTPKPTITPSPVPSPTPVPVKFAVGGSAYFIPELVDAVFGPFKMGRSIKNMQVLDLECGDYDTYQQSQEWVYQGEKGQIEEAKICGEEVFYRVAVEKWTYSDIEYFWVRESQLSAKEPTLGYPFVLGFASDIEEEILVSPYTAYLPEELTLKKGETGTAAINGQSVQITLDQVGEINQGSSKFYRYLSTMFTVHNLGGQQLEFDTKDLIQARANAIMAESNPTVRVDQKDSAEVSIPPNQSAEFEISWRFSQSMWSDHDLAIYFSFNTPIEDNLYVLIHEDSLFFRDVVPLNE